MTRQRPVPPGLKPKDLCGIPWRVALAFQADGWYLRSDIIWHKPNPMPESVTDRPTKAHEYIFLLTKSARYYYDAEAIREAVKPESVARCRAGFLGNDPVRDSHNTYGDGFQRGEGYELTGRNKRSVWTVTTKPFKGAHFATFPPDLIEPCIKAGTSERGVCPECGAPWKRVVEKHRTFESGSGKAGNLPAGKNGPLLQGGGETLDVRMGPCVTTHTLGWQPTCDCDAGDPVPPIVYDPFGGAGTTGLVAFRQGRRYILHELNPEYAQMARDRIVSDAPMLVMMGA